MKPTLGSFEPDDLLRSFFVLKLKDENSTCVFFSPAVIPYTAFVQVLVFHNALQIHRWKGFFKKEVIPLFPPQNYSLLYSLPSRTGFIPYPVTETRNLGIILDYQPQVQLIIKYYCYFSLISVFCSSLFILVLPWLRSTLLFPSPKPSTGFPISRETIPHTIHSTL